MWGYFVLQQRIKALLLLIETCTQSFIALIKKNPYHKNSELTQILYLQILKNEQNIHHCAADLLVFTFY